MPHNLISWTRYEMKTNPWKNKLAQQSDMAILSFIYDLVVQTWCTVQVNSNQTIQRIINRRMVIEKLWPSDRNLGLLFPRHMEMSVTGIKKKKKKRASLGSLFSEAGSWSVSNTIHLWWWRVLIRNVNYGFGLYPSRVIDILSQRRPLDLSTQLWKHGTSEAQISERSLRNPTVDSLERRRILLLHQRCKPRQLEHQHRNAVNLHPEKEKSPSISTS